MSQYDFSALSDHDFELLVRDLLQEDLNTIFESFKRGKDNGIDLRYSAASSGDLIVQCKHYSESSFSTLLSAIKRERPKIEKLNPNRYILVTSFKLSPNNKDKIKNQLGKFCAATSDIFGREDLNNLLGRHSNVERRHYKLWLTSIPILSKILHSDVTNFSNIELERIREKSKLYVQNDSFIEANRILDESQFLIISGIPGIGKSTLAEMLILHYLDKGYEVHRITENISQAVKVYDPNRLQLFYYDDFLGKTSMQEKMEKNEDATLKSMVNSIMKTKNKRLILTTREYILRQAKQTYEGLNDGTFEISKYIIDLSKYTPLIRAKILYNHLYFSDLPTEYREILTRDKFYLKVIDHKNFNPRLIEFMTQKQNLYDIGADTYLEFFYHNLENPEELWQHVFENQIDENSRRFLVALLTTGFTNVKKFEAVFKSLRGLGLNYKQCLKELEGTFIDIDEWFHISFHNPSIIDFIKHYVSTDATEYVDMIIDKCLSFYQLIVIGLQTPEGIKNHLSYLEAIKRFVLKPVQYRSDKNEQYTEEGCDTPYLVRLELLVEWFKRTGNEGYRHLIYELQTLFKSEYWYIEELGQLNRVIHKILCCERFTEKEQEKLVNFLIESFATKGIYWILDIREFTEFMDEHEPSERVMETLKDDFTYFINDSAELIENLEIANDSDELGSYIGDICQLADYLDVGLSHYPIIGRIENRIAEIDKEAVVEDNDGYEYRELEKQKFEMTIKEKKIAIEDLFDSLVKTDS